MRKDNPVGNELSLEIKAPSLKNVLWDLQMLKMNAAFWISF